MKMREYLEMSDADKVTALEAVEGEYYKVTEDKGVCAQCGQETDAGDFCFGCHKLVCLNCIQEGPHLSDCCAN